MSSTLRGYIMTKARDIADGVSTSDFLTSSSTLNPSNLDLNVALPALDGSSLTGIAAGLNTKIVTDTYNSTSTTPITISSLGFEPKHVICRLQLNVNSAAEAVHNMSFGNATKINETTSDYVCSYDYFRQHGLEAYDPVYNTMGRLAYGGGQFNELFVSNWGADSLEITPLALGTVPSVVLRYQLIIQG